VRRANAALAVGGYTPIATQDDLLAYLRERDGQRFLVALNFGSAQQTLDLSALGSGRIVLSTALDRAGESASRALVLQADEGVIVALD
jgi:alpha-glucosidase